MISVIIPTYNRFDLLMNSINSVLNQTHKDFEIIVIDDSSDDERYLELSSNKNIRYFRLEKRTGLPSKVRNFGINQSKGEWIAFLDDDDTWLPNKLEVQMKYTDKYDFICSDALSNGRKWAKEIHLDVWNKVNPLNNLEFNYELINNHNLIINSTVLIKKERLLEINLIPEENELRGIEDYHTWKNVLRLGKVCLFIEEALIQYETNTQKFYKDNYI